MTHSPLSTMRRLAGTLGPVLGLVLACALFVTGVHHHGDASSERSCAMCIASHAPAVATIAVVASAAPTRVTEHLAPVIVDPPCARATRVASSRGPPLV